MTLKRLSKHFLPHFFVDPSFAESFGGQAPLRQGFEGQALVSNRIHHRAHAISSSGLFLVLQILVVVTLGFHFISSEAPNILGTVSFSSDQIVELTNAKRSQNGLSSLSRNSLLAQAAAAKAADMFNADYWAHNSPSGATPWTFISGAGYRYIFAGENLARDFVDPGAVVEAWMNSPTHRSNLLDSNFREIGVAVASGTLGGREGILVVQMFGTSITSGLAQNEGTTTLTLKPSPTPQNSPFPTVAKQSSVSSPSPPSLAASPSPTDTVAQVLPSPKAPLEQFISPQPVDVVSNQVSVLASRKFSIAKGVSLALVGFIFLLFALEVVVTIRRAKVTLRSGVLAHLGFLGVVLFAVWYAVAGAVI